MYADIAVLHMLICNTADLRLSDRYWQELCGEAKPEGTWQDSWRALEHLVDSGTVHSIGELTLLLSSKHMHIL